MESTSGDWGVSDKRQREQILWAVWWGINEEIPLGPVTVSLEMWNISLQISLGVQRSEGQTREGMKWLEFERGAREGLMVY